MDLTTIDVSSCPDLKAGDLQSYHTILGFRGERFTSTAQQMNGAKKMGRDEFPRYAVLCGIHARVKRIYID